MFSKQIKKYSTQQSEYLFIVTMQITTETVHIGWIQSIQFRNFFSSDVTSDLPLLRRACDKWLRELDTGPPDNHQKSIVPSTQILVLTEGDD